MKYLLTLGLLILILIDSSACSCKHVGILMNKKDMSFVFKGSVSKQLEVVSYDTITSINQVIEYRRTVSTFNIVRSYKGLKDKKVIELVTSLMSDCGVSFERGKKYIVYAYTDNKKLHYR
jgi:hypothetical protein